ncbi:SDR family NAD(P)-dependent oxidoreductase [Xylophilus sp. GW821-FHT01B05]
MDPSHQETRTATAAPYRLDGRVAMVTGGARGIGLAIGQRLASEGASVVLCDLDTAALDAARSELSAQGHRVHTVTGSVAISADVARMVAEATGNFGRLDILFNNAGGGAGTPPTLDEVTEADYDKVMDWNMRGTFLCIKAAAGALRASRGAVINMASTAGQFGWSHFSPQYSAAKAAIIGITRNLAKHLGPDGVRVNAVAPGFIRSGPRFDKIWEDTDRAYVMRQIALGRVGDTAELADVVLFLASDQSRYVTGTVINVDGGLLAI